MSDILESLRNTQRREQEQKKKYRGFFEWVVDKLREINSEDDRWLVMHRSLDTCELCFRAWDGAGVFPVVQVKATLTGVLIKRGWMEKSEDLPRSELAIDESHCANAVEKFMHEYILQNDISLKDG